jgi:hypothetical protein
MRQLKSATALIVSQTKWSISLPLELKNGYPCTFLFAYSPIFMFLVGRFRAGFTFSRVFTLDFA